MLQSLEIRDLLIIDHLVLDFQPGLNVLTGETGAGKSILLDALGFVLGWRGRAATVRAGADLGEVTAVFSLPPGHPAHAVLEDAGLPAGDELILRRTTTPEGRRTARINDRRTSAEALRALSETLVELHGQQDDRGLLNASAHLGILDDFAGLRGEVDKVNVLWTKARAASEAVAQARARLEAARAEEDYLRHALDELDKLAPAPGEDADLDSRRRLMQAAERIGEDIARAAQGLGPDGAEGQMAAAMRWLEGAAAKAEGRLDEALAALGRALNELGEAQDGVTRALDEMRFDAAELEQVEERLFAIRALARKHGCVPDDLAALRDDIAAQVAALEGGESDLAGLREAEEAARAAHLRAARALSERRARAAAALDTAMAEELAPLKMERTVFRTVLGPADPGPAGIDRAVFSVATNPGAPAGPLNRIASGGELSRFLLALKLCLVRGAPGAVTMIFDEIDRGVGGATADAVGRRLQRIAEAGQVLVVTHSPQVAARGAHHWHVEKTVTGGATLSRVSALDAAARTEEIARMLAGDRITAEARAAARALLAG